MEFVRLGLVLFLHAYTYIYMINKFFFFIFEILEACDFEEEGGCSPRRGLDSVPVLSSAQSIGRGDKGSMHRSMHAHTSA